MYLHAKFSVMALLTLKSHIQNKYVKWKSKIHKEKPSKF